MNTPCDGGECACPVGFADCNADPGDGCEADLASVTTCGACTNTCDSVPTGASPVCNAGTCGFDCGPTMVVCDNACAPQCDASFEMPGQTPFVVPTSCPRIRVKAWGAGGGNGAGNTGAAAGGFAIVELAVTMGETYAIVVGAPGQAATANFGAGGAPGGGNGGSANSQDGGGGGGFSGVFAMNMIAPEHAIVIAGGGGGSGGGGGNNVRAGAGGGASGQNGAGAGGTQTTGFGPLAGGAGGAQGNGDGGGGGGGGWFGGQGGNGANSDAGGGGGGAAYAGSTTTFQLLAPGNLQVPGQAMDPDRGVAAAPGMPGKVIVSCLP